jgi:hypothetical protein
MRSDTFIRDVAKIGGTLAKIVDMSCCHDAGGGHSGTAISGNGYVADAEEIGNTCEIMYSCKCFATSYAVPIKKVHARLLG